MTQVTYQNDKTLKFPMWLVFSHNGDVRVTRREPKSLGRDERALYLEATLPLSLWATPTLRASLNVAEAEPGANHEARHHRRQRGAQRRAGRRYRFAGEGAGGVKEAVKIGLLAAIAFNLMIIASAVIDIKASISASRGMYLCIEAWKLGAHPSTCGKLTGRRS